MRRVELKGFDGGGAGQELEVPDQHGHGHLQLEEGKPHAKASPGALAKSLEGMRRPEKQMELRISQ